MDDEGEFTLEDYTPQNAQNVNNEEPGTQEQQSAPIRTFLPPMNLICYHYYCPNIAILTSRALHRHCAQFCCVQDEGRLS